LYKNIFNCELNLNHFLFLFQIPKKKKDVEIDIENDIERRAAIRHVNMSKLSLPSSKMFCFLQKLVPYFPRNNILEYKNRMVPLNPNHSSLILVDNGSAEKFGVEIDFRTKLETSIRTNLKISMVLIVVEGGVGTLKTILGALKNETQIILVAVSFFFLPQKLILILTDILFKNTNGCADLVRQAKEIMKEGAIDENLL
jgi:hypothetical protein